MKATEFKKFKNYIENMVTQKEANYIQSCGFFWIDLTENQVNKIAKILKNKGYATKVNKEGYTEVYFGNYVLVITDEITIDCSVND